MNLEVVMPLCLFQTYQLLLSLHLLYIITHPMIVECVLPYTLSCDAFKPVKFWGINFFNF